jgi:hypothetical protein
MKIYIGKYPKHYSFFIHESSGDGWWQKAIEWWNDKIAERLPDFSFRKDRYKYIHIDNHDVWDMSQTLACIILPMLERLKEKKQGAPHIDDEDVPEELRRPAEAHKCDVDEHWFERWDYVLDKMIWSFKQILRDDRMTQFYGEDYFHHDDKASKAYEAEIQVGLKLFAKYYDSLYD